MFLSIGYNACHWCHRLREESFENKDIAALMNQYFINIKVDREERPDLDSIYMDAVVALTGQGGWPMSVFLTPDGVPFYGGTYFPPQARGGLPGFPDLLEGIHDAWVNRRETILKGGKEIIDHIQQTTLAETSGRDSISNGTLTEAVKGVWQSFDWRAAGWGRGPKFPQPMTLEFLLRHFTLNNDPLALEMATKTLDAMMRGGMYDQLGGGFHRYATDAFWLVPHFEKMLYDNSQLALVYLHAYQILGGDVPTGRLYKKCVEEILDYVLREMTDSSGGFYSTQDADSEGVEGKFFVWDEAEIDSILQLPKGSQPSGSSSATLFKAAYGVTTHGNFEEKNILFVAKEIDDLAKQFNLPREEVEKRLAAMRKTLFDIRERRIKPNLDDKVLSGWNGLMLAAFAEAARILKRDDYRKAAVNNAEFLLRDMIRQDPSGLKDPKGLKRLHRSWRNGQAKLNGYLEDYANVIFGLLTLYETVFDEKYFIAAQELTETMIQFFSDPQGGFFDTSSDHESLVVRPKSMQDNATPSGNAMAATVLFKLAALTGDGGYTDIATKMLESVQGVLTRYPTGFAQWLVAQSFYVSKPKEIAIIGNLNDADTQAMLDVVNETYRPFAVVAVGAKDSPIPLLNGRDQLNGKATVYVCENFACKLPVNEAEKLRELLEIKD
ncbi:MAG: thioredoxin domain-containing protein [Chloroflexi bacterium]|nr:thioredoxin domain-containing protein [Chloroflexota bacterium]